MKKSSLSDYYQTVGSKKALKARHERKTIRIAIIGSFTLNGFSQVLKEMCRQVGLKASFYEGGYNQFVQEISDVNSGLYKFKPELTFLLVDASGLLGSAYAEPYSLSERGRKSAVLEGFRKMEALAKKFVKTSGSVLVINNFEVPVYSPLGIMETKEKFGYFDMVRKLNSLMLGLSEDRNTFIFDYDSFASSVGKVHIRDDKMAYLADMKIAPDLIVPLCDEYMRYIKALKGLSRKCLVLDLDNTLWGGIVGEDGLEGIRLGPSAPGNAFLDFQRQILSLFKRGVILAINSSNNRQDALKVLREHPYMVLKEKHFASMKINWESKVRNLVDIAKEINIGLDGLIFIEDDKRIRQVVTEALPQVLCPEVPEDPSLYVRLLSSIKDLDALQITREDRSRGKSYASERMRNETKFSFNDLGRYLKHLNIVVRLARADKFSIPRISQLTLRTNQFNFSGRRYTEQEISDMMKDRNRDVYHIDIKDKYGDYGTTGAIVVSKKNDQWLIDTFLLSCRVLGKGIEDAVIASLIEKARKAGAEEVLISYAQTQKNKPALDFLNRNGVRLPAKHGLKSASIIIYKKDQRSNFSVRGAHIKMVTK